MFEKWKKKIKKDKRIIICFHGFGTRMSHEYDNFLLWSKDEFELITFDIYDLNNPLDCDSTTWIKKCERKIESYINDGYKVDVVGFSMGGVLATHVASMFPINRLFLISPAFDYIHISNITNIIINKINKPQTNTKKPKLPSGFTSCFMDVIKKCKDDIAYVDCPICIVQGDKDEIIPLRSSINAYEKISHDQKKLFVIHGGMHRMMLHKNTCWETYQLFKLFMNQQILSDLPSDYAKDIYEEK